MPQATMNLMRECIPLFTVLADENRHKILQLLLENGKMNVNAITERLHLSRPAVSHHLKIMLDAKTVTVEQIGKERFYAIAMMEATEKLQRLAIEFAAHCPSNQ